MYLIGIIISVVILVWIGFKVDFSLLLKSFAELDSYWVLLMIVIYLAGFLARGLRSKFMLMPIKEVTFRSATESVIVGYTANSILPARAGEFVRAIFLGKKESISRTSVLGTVFIERVFDGLILVAILIACSSLMQPDEINHRVIHAIVVTGCIIFGVAVSFIMAGASNRS